MVFDGSAFSKLVSSNWKSWLNKNYNWTVGKIGPNGTLNKAIVCYFTIDLPRSRHHHLIHHF